MVVRKECDVLMDDGQGLTDSELTQAFRASNDMNAYQFKNDSTSQTTTVNFSARMRRVEEDLEFSEIFSLYLRKIDRQLQNEFNENITRRGEADTYDHTRRIPNRR